MHTFVKDANGRKQITELSFVQSKQASAIADAVARLIPQEGVDFDIESPSVSFNLRPHTDKGKWLGGYIAKTIDLDKSVAVRDCVGRLIPKEGIDYDIEVLFNGENDKSVSMGIVALTEKGRLWREYAMPMLGKNPPTIENPPEAIQEEPEQKPDESEVVVPEVIDAQVVS
jgi:hypothetical protein